MTLTQRLTRAGATFIVFGAAAAFIPQQNQTVRADACTPQSYDFVLVAGALQETTSPSTASGAFSVPSDALLSVNGQINGEADLDTPNSSFLSVSDANFTGRALTMVVNNTASSGTFYYGDTSSTTAGTAIDAGTTDSHATTQAGRQYGIRLRKSGSPTGTLTFTFVYNSNSYNRTLTLF